MRSQNGRHHNDFIFQSSGNKVSLIRDFEGMYRECEDPHGQSGELGNLSYHLVAATVTRAVQDFAEQGAENPAIVDIGCGLGFFTGYLQRKFPGVEVFGVDISQSALNQAQTNAPACQFFRADLKEPGLSINSGRRFEIAVALDSLYYFTNGEIGPVLHNLFDVLVDNGLVIVGYHLPEKMGFGRYIRSLNDAKKLFARHRMEIVYSFDVNNNLDTIYDGSPVGRHLYFMARKMSD